MSTTEEVQCEELNINTSLGFVSVFCMSSWTNEKETFYIKNMNQEKHNGNIIYDFQIMNKIISP